MDDRNNYQNKDPSLILGAWTFLFGTIKWGTIGSSESTNDYSNTFRVLSFIYPMGPAWMENVSSVWNVERFELFIRGLLGIHLCKPVIAGLGYTNVKLHTLKESVIPCMNKIMMFIYILFMYSYRYPDLDSCTLLLWPAHLHELRSGATCDCVSASSLTRTKMSAGMGIEACFRELFICNSYKENQLLQDSALNNLAIRMVICCIKLGLSCTTTQMHSLLPFC